VEEEVDEQLTGRRALEQGADDVVEVRHRRVVHRERPVQVESDPRPPICLPERPEEGEDEKADSDSSEPVEDTAGSGALAHDADS
jgi:hypothetical protein